MSIWLILIRTIPVSLGPHLAYSRVRIKPEVSSNCNVQQRFLKHVKSICGFVMNNFIASGAESLLTSMIHPYGGINALLSPTTLSQC